MEKECGSELSHPLTVDRCILEVKHKDETEKLCEASQQQLQLIYRPVTGRVSHYVASISFHTYSCPPPESYIVGPLVFNDRHNNCNCMEKSRTETFLLI